MKIKEFCRKNRYFIIIGAVVFCSMLILNSMTTYTSDDFYYFYNFATGERIRSIGDIFESLGAHYMRTNGRLVLHFFVQLFLLLPRPVFIVFNSVMYTWLGFLLYMHINYKKERRISLLLFTFIGMWFLLPSFGETVLWTDGACNYLWGTAIILTFLLPYRMYMDNQRILENKIWIVLMFLFGIIAGWCNENTSGAAWLMILLSLVIYKIYKIKIPAWSVTGLIGCLSGFAAMILAPGNRNRASSAVYGAGQYSSLMRALLGRYVVITEKISSGVYGWLLLLTVFLVAYLIVKNKSVKKELPAIGYVVCFLGGSYAMLLSSYLPERTLFGSVCFWIVGIGMLLSEAVHNTNLSVMTGVSVCLISFFLISYSYAFIDNAIVWRAYQHRLEYVQSEKEKGNLDLVVDYIPTQGTRCGWWDISHEKDNTYNKRTAELYGIHSIRVMSE